MPLNNTKEFLAKVAFSQASRVQSDLPEHYLEDATWYVDEALGQMEDESTYDPETYAIRLSERTIVAYVKLKLLDRDPLNDEEYLDAFTQWVRQAAREWFDAQPSATLAERIGKKVFIETIREAGRILRTHDMSDCQDFATEAQAYLLDQWGYDPATYATDLADRALVDYGLSKMTGEDPSASQPVNESIVRWATRAAREYIDAQIASDGKEALLIRLNTGKVPTLENLVDANRYADEARTHLLENWGYDPAVHAEPLATKFAVEWAVHRLDDENPLNNDETKETGRRWASRAAREYLNLQVDSDGKTALLIRLGDGQTPALELLADANRYALEGRAYLEEIWGFDPATLAAPLATKYAVEYAIKRLKDDDPTTNQEMVTTAERWAAEAAREYADAQVKVTDEDTIAYNGFITYIAEGGQPILHDYTDALRYADDSLGYLQDIGTWDPTTDGIASADRARARYVTTMLRGIEPSADQQLVSALEAWMRAAALDADYSDGYPDFPDYRKRIRNHTTKKWNP